MQRSILGVVRIFMVLSPPIYSPLPIRGSAPDPDHLS
jgi:hypothetical protein